MIGTAIQGHLKAVFKLGPGVSPAAVTRRVKRLQELNLARRVRNEEIQLTPSDEKIALEMIRHHRPPEAHLSEVLGYSWDRVHHGAENPEHVISEEFEVRIDAILGFPSHDPHGDPIPTRDGQIPQEEHERLGAATQA